VSIGGLELLEIILISAVAVALCGAVRLEQVQEGECGLILRFGKHCRTVRPGPLLLLRGADSLIRVTTKIIMFTDLVAENCTTGDGAVLSVRYHLMLRAAFPAKILKIEDWQEASLVQAEVVVREAISNRPFTAAMGDRVQFGALLSAELDQKICTWGAAGEIEVADILLSHTEPTA
jgi:regulator of protease activity HflC (stomatin/prohibitin superfamily)